MNTLKSIPVFVLALMLACSNTNSPDNSNADSTSTAVDNEPAGGEAAITDYAKTLPLDKIKLPTGFTIDVYAEVENARSMALSHRVRCGCDAHGSGHRLGQSGAWPRSVAVRGSLHRTWCGPSRGRGSPPG